MKRSLLLICCLVSMIQVAVAQVSLTGVLTDSLGTVITKESSVTLVTKKDMLKVAQGKVSQGQFSLEYNPQAGREYLLYVFALGYKERYLDVTGKEGDLGNIRLSPLSVALQEVIVKPGRLQHDIVNGNDVFKIEGTELAQEHSLTTMFRRLPGIMVMQDEVTVVGAGSPIYTINGEAPRSGEMDVITPDRIEKVTVNTMPSAKYSANVTSIIDLQLKKRLRDYISVYVANQNHINSEVFKENPKVGITMSGSKFSTYIGYSYGYNNTSMKLKYLEQTQLPDETDYSMSSALSTHGIDWTHSFNIAPKYQIDDRSYVDVQYSLSGLKSRHHQDDDVLRQTMKGDEETEHVQSLLTTNGKRKSWKHDLSARYVNAFSPNKKLTLNVGYSNNSVNHNQVYDEIVAENVNSFLTDREANSETMTATVDYQTLLWKKLTVEAGARYVYLNSDNQNRYDDESAEDALVEAEEQTAVGYLNVSQTVGKFFYSLGLRGEYQYLINDFHALDRKETEHSFYVIPKVGLNYRPSKDLSMNLSYNYSRYNPSPVDLDPTVYYENTYSYRVGNPDLKPSELHSTRLRVTYLPLSLTLTANYDYTHNGIQYVFLNDENNPQVIKNTFENRDISKVGVSLSYNRQWGIYTLNCSAGYKQEFAKATYLGEEMDYSRPQLDIYASNYFSLPKGFSLTASLYYNTPRMSFPQYSAYSIMGDFSLGYAYKNFSATLSCSVSNRGYMYQQYAYLYRYSKFCTPREQFRLSINYKFSKVKQWFMKNNVNSEAIRRSISSY